MTLSTIMKEVRTAYTAYITSLHFPYHSHMLRNSKHQREAKNQNRKENRKRTEESSI